MSTDFAKQYKSARQRLLDFLHDRDWHRWKELELVAGNRYAARMLELRRLGYKFEDREDSSGDGKTYRLIGMGEPVGKRVKVFLNEQDAAALCDQGIVTPEAKVAIRDALGSFRANKHKL